MDSDKSLGRKSPCSAIVLTYGLVGVSSRALARTTSRAHQPPVGASSLREWPYSTQNPRISVMNEVFDVITIGRCGVDFYPTEHGSLVLSLIHI